MLNGKRITVVLPAYNAAKTLHQTVSELDLNVVDDVLLVDDCSADETVALAQKMGIRCFLHDKNYGYGRNQKTCYSEALKSGADVIVMLHPDYQYSPKLVSAMAAMVVSEEYDVVLGSRILGGKTRKSGMPLYKYISNRLLTLAENLLLGSKLSEFHTGYRAFSRRVSWKNYRSLKTLMTSFLTTRCWLRRFISIFRWGRSHAPHATFPRPRQLIFGGLLYTDSESCGPRYASGSRNGEWPVFAFSPVPMSDS